MLDGTRFGEVADVYDDARPAYAPGLAEALAAYHGSTPGDVLEIGAGTGKGTAVLHALGGRLTCVEPDPRMAALLAARFPAATVIVAPFEEAGAGPADVVGCALAWHWLDPERRNRLAFDALRPGGTLAVFGHRYDYADPAHRRAFDEAFAAVDQTPAVVRDDAWVHRDVLASGLWADVRAEATSRTLPLDAAAYLRLVRTFGPFRAKSPQAQERTLDVLARTLDALGGGTVLDLRGFLVLARRPANRAGVAPRADN
ncbi:methyltransferase domain-containing protein [Dactylosporangium sp. CA-052675]|uniref:methyltransferase domain-containing protein n=1 Tax=Dactylosporangium sp. CA-052675 TaxID=3239927 RepID=UPI003D8C1A9E